MISAKELDQFVYEDIITKNNFSMNNSLKYLKITMKYQEALKFYILGTKFPASEAPRFHHSLTYKTYLGVCISWTIICQ